MKERVIKLEERVSEVITELRGLRRLVNVVAHRYGVLSKSTFHEGTR